MVGGEKHMAQRGFISSLRNEIINLISSPTRDRQAGIVIVSGGAGRRLHHPITVTSFWAYIALPPKSHNRKTLIIQLTAVKHPSLSTQT